MSIASEAAEQDFYGRAQNGSGHYAIAYALLQIAKRLDVHDEAAGALLQIADSLGRLSDATADRES